MQTYQYRTVPFTGDFFRTHSGKIYQAVKTNPKNCVSRDESGKLWNVRYENIAQTGIADPGWEKPADAPRPGEVIHIKQTSGLYGRRWFKQYTPATLFVVTSSDATKVSFVPLGGKGMPETTVGYSTLPDWCEVVDISSLL